MNVAEHGMRVGELVMVCNYRQAAIFQRQRGRHHGGHGHARRRRRCRQLQQGPGPAHGLHRHRRTTYQFRPRVSLVGRFVAVGWYIGNNGRPETGGRSLYRVTRNGVEEVAEGVRDMQMSYLVDGAADYVDAGAVTADQWENVTAVRFDLTFESPDSRHQRRYGQRLVRTVAYTVNLRNQQP
jgi:type IV pilus assembly protein PilW